MTRDEADALLEHVDDAVVASWLADPTLPVVALQRGELILDVLSMTNMLYESHGRSSGGASANEWTKLFEKQVQSRIDSSPWAPPPGPLRGLIGRTIRDAELNVITDLDVVGYRDGVLLLVDCKARAMNEALQRGEYNAVQNRSQTVEHDVAAWKTKVEAITSAVDLLRLPASIPISKVEWVVVYPTVPYVLEGPATELSPLGYHRASTDRELMDVLTDEAAGSATWSDFGRSSRSGWAEEGLHISRPCPAHGDSDLGKHPLLAGPPMAGSAMVRT